MGSCRLTPHDWGGEPDGETLERVDFRRDGTGTLSYCFNRFCTRDVSFEYEARDERELVLRYQGAWRGRTARIR